MRTLNKGGNMPVLDKNDSLKEELSPGVGRWRLLDSETGAEALTVADLTLDKATLQDALRRR